MNLSHSAISSQERRRELFDCEPLPLLDVATIVGGGVLSAAGLLRGGIRGWVSTTLGTLLLYRGFIAVQEHAAAAARSCDAATGETRSFTGQSSRSSDPRAHVDPAVFPMKGTCTSPGIVAPM